jgi:uncharacterized membrane protein YagU involved in acid resistance
MSTITSPKPIAKTHTHSAIKTILLSGFIAGTLDILAAFVLAYILGKVTPVRVLQSVASGAFGKDAFTGGTTTALFGLLFHYIIAYCFAIAYFIIFPYIIFLGKLKILGGLLYGIFAWLLMNLVVVPLSNVNRPSMQWDAMVRGIIVLMLCIGLPISLITHRYYITKWRSGVE